MSRRRYVTQRETPEELERILAGVRAELEGATCYWLTGEPLPQGWEWMTRNDDTENQRPAELDDGDATAAGARDAGEPGVPPRGRESGRLSAMAASQGDAHHHGDPAGEETEMVVAGMVPAAGTRWIADVDCKACGESHSGVALREPPAFSNLAGKFYVFTCPTLRADALVRTGSIGNVQTSNDDETEAGWILPAP